MSNRAEGVGVSINIVTRLPKDRMSRCPKWLPRLGFHPQVSFASNGRADWPGGRRAEGKVCRAVVILHRADTGPQHRESKPTSPPCLHLYCFNSNMTFMLETLDATNKLFYFPS